MAPMMVPTNAMATVRPSCRGVRPNRSVKECVVPAMTAVSNPNKRPPKAPTAVAFNRVEFNFIDLPACGVFDAPLKLSPNGEIFIGKTLEAALSNRKFYFELETLRCGCRCDGLES